ncbi:hypothetical protein TcYC6_0007880 [Trypanosoma cruzi]|nr:hypothetical protein TcYC6_0007880 [Trypanosoma cruzi]
MIHPFALVFSGLLTSSAVLGGHLPAAVLLIYMMLLRNPKCATSPIVLVLAFLFAVLQLLSTLIVNLLVAFSPSTRGGLFVHHRVLIESFGIYEAGPGVKAWILAGACVPSGLICVYIIYFRKKLLSRISMGRVRPLLTTVSWALMSVATGLIFPTVLAGVLLVIGMMALSCVGLGGARTIFGAARSRPRRFLLLFLHFCSLCGTFASCIILVASCVSQNAAVACALDNLDPMYGLNKLYEQPADIAICRFVQLCLMMVTLFLAQMAMECHGKELQQQNAGDPLLREEVSNNNARVAEGTQGTSVAVVFNHADVPSAPNFASAAVPSHSNHHLSRPLNVPHGLSLAGHSSPNSSAAFGTNYLERGLVVCGSLGTWMMRKLFASSRMLPLAFMAANMVAFPSVVSLSLLPTMMLGQLVRFHFFASLLRPTLVLNFFLVNVQYVVLATASIQPPIVRHLFLGDEGRWWGLAQVISSEIIFLAMLAADAAIRQQYRLAHSEEDHPDEIVVPHPPPLPSIAPSSPTASHVTREFVALSDGKDSSSESGGDTSLDFLGIWRHAEFKLGARRVAELLAYVPSEPLESSEAFEQLFSFLVGRRPTAEEEKCLCKEGIGDALLREKLHDSQSPLLSYYVHWAGILLMRHAVLIALLLLFIVGSFTYQMDILHAIVLLLFVLYFFLPDSMDDAWMFVVIYLMLLTSFKLIFTFVSEFVTLSVYIAGSPLQYATVGLVPLRSRYEAIPYVVAVFILTFLFLRIRVCRSWGTAVSLHEWDRFCHSNTARQWSMRVTMTVATTVFVALGVFLHYSFIVEGFLALFLLLTISAAAFSLSGAFLGVLWSVACVYSGIVVVVTSVCQFTQLADLIREHVFQRLCGHDGDGSGNSTNARRCEQESGLYPVREDMPLTLFLAPWFLAFATAMLHRAVKHVRETPPRWARQPDGSGGLVGMTVEQQEEQPKRGEQSEGEQRVVPVECVSLPCLESDDQRFIRHMLRLLAVMDKLGDWIAAFGSDYGGILVWVSLFLAATYRFTAIGSVYMLFFLLDLTHISVLVYCVLHILVLYTYKFSFVPEITYSIYNVPLAAVIGLEKKGGNALFEHVIGPVIVFFVMLLRIHTCGANREVRRRQRTEGPESSNWKSVLCTQLFFYAGYEGLVLTLLLVLACSSHSCIGAFVGLAVLPLLLATGRQQLHRVSYSFPLLLLLSLMVLWQYALLLNAAHRLFPAIADYSEAKETDGMWEYWVFTSRYHTLLGCVLGIMLLHTSRQQSGDTAVSFSMLRSQFNGHVTLVNFVRAASVGSLQLLPRDTFDLVVPSFVESLPPSCLGRVTTFMVFAVSYLCPVAFLSFAAGVMSQPSVINLLLIIGGLLQVAQMEMLHWTFFSLWPFITMAYWFLITLTVVCNAPYVRQFILEHYGLSEVLGLLQAGKPFQLGSLHVLLLFMVTLQTRVYDEFRYTKLLRHLYDRTATRHTRHEELWAWLRGKQEAEQQLADARSRALHAKLEEIRSTLHGAHHAWVPEDSSTQKCSANAVTNSQQLKDEKMMMMMARQRIADDDDDTAARLKREEEEEEEEKEERSAKGSMLTDDKVKVSKKKSEKGGTCAHKFKTGLQRIIHVSATKLANWLAVHTYEPHRHTAAHYRGLFSRLFWVTIRALERHTVMVVLLATMINFMLSQCVWELLPFCFMLVVAIAYHPFPPRPIFVFFSFYVALGILLKALIDVVLAQVSYSPGLLKILGWTILHVSEGAYWKQRIGYSYVMMDFVVFATLLLHQDICLANGVYSRKDILRSREGEQAAGNTKGTNNDPLPPPSPSSSVPAIYSPSSFGDAASGTEQLPAGRSPMEDPIRRSRTSCMMGIYRKVCLAVLGFVRNATSIPGVGRDWYIYYSTVEAIALLVSVFGYNKLSGWVEDTLQESVKRNLLPGPMVTVVLVSILYMIADRMLYVTQCMKGKLLLNTVTGVAYCILYMLWGNLLTVSSRVVGNLFFTLKVLALTIAVIQVRVGYPRHRRHDPFTWTAGRSGIAGYLYFWYRCLPFLWEIRVVTDWTVEKTSLHLDNYLKIEDLYDIVFERQCKLYNVCKQRQALGTPIPRSTKVTAGLSRLVLFVGALMVPLVYYSTFNPSMQSNEVTQLRVGLSFMSSQPFYASTTFTAEEIPNEWSLWLARTRPSLDRNGIMNTKKTLQLVNVSSCSNELWPISPQAYGRLNEQLMEVMENKTTMQLFQTIELSRSGTSNFVSHTQSWTFSWEAARDIHRMLNNPTTNGTGYVKLQNFYTPFLFSHPDGLAAFDGGGGVNVMDCSILLRQEVDSVLNNTVRYWCVECQSLFTHGNIPNSNKTRFPEWGCLSTGEGCSKFNFERRNGDVNYNPVPMYFVVLSDPSVGGVPFLQGIGIVALYTTFVLALGRIFRGMFANKAKYTILSDMADPTPIAQLIEYITVARECGDLPLEQSVYIELVDLLRSPERLLRLTGFNRQMYDAETDVIQSPHATPSNRMTENLSHRGDALRGPEAGIAPADDAAREVNVAGHEKKE